MSMHCFFIPARTPEPAQSEVNRFMAGQRVVAVRKEWMTRHRPHQSLRPAAFGPIARCANRKGPGVLVGGDGRRTPPGEFRNAHRHTQGHPYVAR
ncbi:MAG: hypothetical protein E6Q88_05015 [Lysobacteraceae bacterium]|nr:MAG: hypothetical protein E6Q88_05015 [Xanthomonadaceae bacterium]